MDYFQKSVPLSSSVQRTWKIASVHLKLPALKVMGISFGIKGCIFRSKLLLKAENISRSEERRKYICGGTRGETDWIPNSGKIRQRLFFFSFSFALSTILISHRDSKPEHILEWRLLHLIPGRDMQVWGNHSQNDNKHPPSGGKWHRRAFWAIHRGIEGKKQQFEGVSFNDEAAVSNMALSRDSSLFHLKHKATAACPLQGISRLSHKTNDNSAWYFEKC